MKNNSLQRTIKKIESLFLTFNEKFYDIELQKPITRKYVCPVCGMIVRATKEVHIKCGDCDVELKKIGR